MTATVINGDCLAELKNLSDNSVDSVVTDPPYALGFMGKSWDKFDTPGASTGLVAGPTGRAHSHGIINNEPYAFQAWCQQWASECLRVLKPGGHLLAFGGTRTYHRLTSGVEDAGFEIRDSLHWIYGSGFPKSLDVSKAIDKQAGAKRDIDAAVHRPEIRTAYGKNAAAVRCLTCGNSRNGTSCHCKLPSPVTTAAYRWQGWGTALKPAHEPIILARKPLAAATVAANVTEHGVGGINVDGCRIGTDVMTESRMSQTPGGTLNMNGRDTQHGNWKQKPNDNPAEHQGRWPANILLTHSPGCVNTGTKRVKPSNGSGRASDKSGGFSKGLFGNGTSDNIGGEFVDSEGMETVDSYDCATGCPVAEIDRQSGNCRSAGKYSKGSRPQGDKSGAASIPIDGITSSTYADSGGASRFFYCAKAPRKERPTVDGTTHPTVKPLNLIRWLTRLVTPVGGTVLDPFAGSGTTGQACALEGFNSILIEREPSYIPLIEKRLADGG